MPIQVDLPKDYFLIRTNRKENMLDCLHKKGVSWKFVIGKDFPKDRKPQSIVARIIAWERKTGLKVLTHIEQDGSVVAWSEEMTDEERAVRKAKGEQFAMRLAAKRLRDRAAAGQ